MAVDDVGRGAANECGEARHRREVAHAGIAADRHGRQPELQAAGDAGKRGFDPRTDGVAVEYHADLMAARALFGGQIDDMAKQAAERGAKDVNDAKFQRLQLGRRHRKNPPGSMAFW